MHTTLNPATEAPLNEYKLHSDSEAATIIEHAHSAYLQWRDVPVEKRADIIRTIGKKLREHKSELAAIMTAEMGKPLAQSEGEVDLCAAICDYTASEGPAHIADEQQPLDEGTALITYQPLGVILAIEPWNFPLYQAIRYSIPNLLVGNTSALKHASNVWGTAELLQKIFYNAGVPEHAFGLLFLKDDQIAPLIAHDKVRGVTLTGSSRAGAAVAEQAGKHLKKSVLELGGSDPYIILEDAPIDDIIGTCVTARVLNSGQTCICAKRFIIVDAIYEKFRDAYVKAMQHVRLGDPTAKDTDMGPMARKDLRDNLHRQVRQSIDKGATCLLGGELPEGKGFYYPATVLENITPGMPAYDEELFGPVAALIRAKDEAEAINIANDSEYGLAGGIFSSDEARAVKIARAQMQCGMVNVNGYNLVKPHLPFGGIKNSGYGREHGKFGLHEFVNIKTIMVSR